MAPPPRPSRQEHATEESPIPAITDEELRRHVVSTYRAVQDIRTQIIEFRTSLIGNDLGTVGVIPRLINVENSTATSAPLVEQIPALIVTVNKHEKRFAVWGAYIVAAGLTLSYIAKLLKLT